jgi:hypothetical protein
MATKFSSLLLPLSRTNTWSMRENGARKPLAHSVLARCVIQAVDNACQEIDPPRDASRVSRNVFHQDIREADLSASYIAPFRVVKSHCAVPVLFSVFTRTGQKCSLTSTSYVTSDGLCGQLRSETCRDMARLRWAVESWYPQLNPKPGGSTRCPANDYKNRDLLLLPHRLFSSSSVTI